MALNKAILEQQIKLVLDSNSGQSNIDPQDARNKLARDLANAIDTYVKGAVVTATGIGNTGAPVQSTGFLS